MPIRWGTERASRKARPSQMENRHDPCRSRGEKGHALGNAIDAMSANSARVRVEERGDERPAAGDADPPDKIGDREPPGDRNVDAPDADARREQPGRRRGRRAMRSAAAKPIARYHQRGRFPGEDDVAQGFSHRREEVSSARSPAARGTLGHRRASHLRDSGFGLRDARFVARTRTRVELASTRSRAGSPCAWRPRSQDRCGRRRRWPASGRPAGRRYDLAVARSVGCPDRRRSCASRMRWTQ